jgi:hypothetical protein
MINSYPSVYQVGHSAISNLFDGEVQIEEKIDGSQFSFGVLDGEVFCKSKNVRFTPDMAEKMFKKAANTVIELLPNLHDGWQYRCEFLGTPKHNTLAYERTPNKYLILFDINTGLEEYMSYEDKKAEADRIGLECVPLLYRGKVETYDQFKQFIELTSILGGCKVEGVVIKNYSQFTKDKKVAMGKYVSESFQEINAGDWRKRNPTNKDVLGELVLKYKTPARWMKAVQHLKENEIFEGSPRDIPNLMKETNQDILKECGDEIKEYLFNHFWKKLSRELTRGLPEWYKDELAKSAFEEVN